MFSSSERALESVLERALGGSLTGLHPQVRDYVRALPPGASGHGEGRYRVAGLRVRMLRPAFAVLARAGIAFPERERDIRFTVTNIDAVDGSRHAVRTFSFAARTRIMVDEMRMERGTLVDRLGRHGRLEVSLHPSVEGGALIMHSGALRLRWGRVRLPLPHVATVILREESVEEGLQRVRVAIRMPLLGEVYGYEGTFRYSVR